MTTTASAPIPSFGDEDSGERKICFVCSKGNLDMAYPALVMANGALGEGIETHIFFTFWGMDMINKKTQEHLKFTFLGNTAMHPGKSGMSMPQGLGGLPGMTAMATKMMKEQNRCARSPRGSRVHDAASRHGRQVLGVQAVGGHDGPHPGGHDR